MSKDTSAIRQNKQSLQRVIISAIAIGFFLSDVSEVTGQPVMEIAPDSVHANLFTGGKTVEKLTVSNNGDLDLVFNISILPPNNRTSEETMGVIKVKESSISMESLIDYPPTITSSPDQPTPTLASRTLVPADFLVIDHGKVKTFLNNYTHFLISEMDLNSLTVDDFRQYEVIYFEPDWFDYNNLSNNMSKISSYVESGGVVVINVAGNIGDGLGIAPLGTNYAGYDGNFGGHYHDFEAIEDSAHPYITGEPYGGYLLGDTDFSWWFTTDHGHLFDYPESSHVVLNNFPNASWLEYKLGMGHVIVTTLTYGWGLGGARGNPLENLVKYSIYLAQTAWLSISATSGVLTPGSSIDLDVTFDAANLIAGDYSALISIQSNDPISTNLKIPVVLHVSEFPCGDANGDGKVDQNDLTYIRQAYFYCGPEPISMNSFDFNCNAQLDLTDVFVLERFLEGIGTLKCCFDSLFHSQ